MEGASKKIFSGVFWSIAQNVVSILYGIVSVPFLINYFGKEQYGLIGLALSVNVYISLLDMGMTNTNIKFLSEFFAQKDRDKVQRLLSLSLWLYIIVGIINTIVLLGASFYVDSFFKVTEDQSYVLRNLLWILSLNATFSWISVVFDQLLKAKLLISWIQKRNVFLKVFQFVALVLTILLHFSIELYFFMYILSSTAILPLTLMKSKRIEPCLEYRPRYDRGIFKLTMPYALSIFSFSIFQFLALNFRPLFLGGFSGPASVADFSILNTIATVVTAISTTFIQVLLPILTQMRVEGDGEGIQRMMMIGSKYVTILLSFIIFNLVLSVKEILILYVGEEYVFLQKWAIIWLLTLLMSHRNVMTSLVFTEKRLVSLVYMGFISMFVALICYLIFIPSMGVGGVVVGFLMHEFIHTLFYYVYFLPYKMYIKTSIIFFKSVLPTLSLLGLVCYVIYHYSILFEFDTVKMLLIKNSIFSILFVTIIYCIVLNNSDRLRIRHILKIDSK